jgi:Tol biopolymer transport system component
MSMSTLITAVRSGPGRFAGLLIAISAASAHAQSIVRIDVADDGSESPGWVESVDVSDDGTRVAFATYVDGIDPLDVNGREDILLRDLVAGTTRLVSVRTSGVQATGNSRLPRISGDGKFVAFHSDARNLVNFDTNGVTDVFLRDLAAGTTQRVSVASDGTEGNGWSSLAAISVDGNLVLYLSASTNLVAGDTNGAFDVFVRARGHQPDGSLARDVH